MTTEMKTLQMDMEDILAKAKKSFDSVGAEVITDEENNKQWRVGKYIFSHTIPTGRKYGKSSVIIEGQEDITLDTNGFDKTIMCIVYFLRIPVFPKTRAPSKKKKVEVKKVTQKGTPHYEIPDNVEIMGD